MVRARVWFRCAAMHDLVSPVLVRPALLGWEDGWFEFRLGSVDRADRVQTPTTALLLDLARERDESRQED